MSLAAILVYLCIWITVYCVSPSLEQNVIANNQLKFSRKPAVPPNYLPTKRTLLPKYDVRVKKYTVKTQRNLIRVPQLQSVDQTIAQTPRVEWSTVSTTKLTTPRPEITQALTTRKPHAPRENCNCIEMKKQIESLQEESRNLNFRVSQLYIQLLEEIINKKDETIRYTELQNQLLNETVRHYQLREMHYELRSMVVNMGNTLVEQRQLVRNLEKRPGTLTPGVSKVGVVNVPLRPIQIISNIPQLAKIPKPQQPTTPPPSIEAILGGPYEDCLQAQLDGHSKSGIYIIEVQDEEGHRRPINAWCDHSQDPGGWLVIQRRVGGKTNFHRNMLNYKKGFGAIFSDFWLGLENIHQITNIPGLNYKLHIDMEDWEGRSTFVEYMSFRVTGEDDGYRLKISHYSGDAGDSLGWHNNMMFTTKNVDNDKFAKNCANYQKGGWWYNMCAHSNLNGIYHNGGHYRSKYQDGIYWSDWHGGAYSLKSVSMKIRPTE